MNEFLSFVLKGLAMGAANVIPGVSGGTIALITGIYERLINAIKSCDLQALRLLLRGNWTALWQHTDAGFLSAVLTGVLVSIISLARLLEYLLQHFEVLTMAYFFGLILVSVWFVGKTIDRWSGSCAILLIAGASIAVGIALLVPAGENSSFGYMFLCGVVAICSMIMPGLSGSFILIVMGNYALVLGAINRFELELLLPLGLGCVAGLIAFSHFLAWVFSRYRNQTIALMTGFIVGSLATIWPWKETLTTQIVAEGKAPKEVVTGYLWQWPALGDSGSWMAILIIVLGGVTIWLTERFAR